MRQVNKVSTRQLKLRDNSARITKLQEYTNIYYLFNY